MALVPYPASASIQPQAAGPWTPVPGVNCAMSISGYRGFVRINLVISQSVANTPPYFMPQLMFLSSGATNPTRIVTEFKVAV